MARASLARHQQGVNLGFAAAANSRRQAFFDLPVDWRALLSPITGQSGVTVPPHPPPPPSPSLGDHPIAHHSHPWHYHPRIVTKKPLSATVAPTIPRGDTRRGDDGADATREGDNTPTAATAVSQESNSPRRTRTQIPTTSSGTSCIQAPQVPQRSY